MTGKLLVLEGIDGCGKTTQIHYLSKWLPNSGLMPKNARLHITREPGGTALGIALRELLLSQKNGKSPYPTTELLLYAADRAQHVSQVIQPALNKGDWILSDRFSGSTLAYQGYGRNLNLKVIKQLEDIATQGLSPDLTLWMDLPLKDSLTRRESKPNDRIESEGVEFLMRVRLGFEILAKERKWVRINAALKSDLVSASIKIAIQEFLGIIE